MAWRLQYRACGNPFKVEDPSALENGRGAVFYNLTTTSRVCFANACIRPKIAWVNKQDE